MVPLLGVVLEEDGDSGVSERRSILWIAVDADRVVVVWFGLDAAWRTSLLRTLADAMVVSLFFALLTLDSALTKIFDVDGSREGAGSFYLELSHA